MYCTSIRTRWALASTLAVAGCAAPGPVGSDTYAGFVAEPPAAAPTPEQPPATPPTATPPPTTPPTTTPPTSEPPAEEEPPVEQCFPDPYGTVCRAIADAPSLGDEPLTIRLATGDEITLDGEQSIDAAMELCEALNTDDDYCVLERCANAVEPPDDPCSDDGMSDWHLCEAILTGDLGGGPSLPTIEMAECPPLTFPFVGAVSCYVNWLIANAIDLATGALTVSADFILTAFGDIYPVLYGILTNPLVVGILDPIVTPLLGGFLSLQDLVLLLPPPDTLLSC